MGRFRKRIGRVLALLAALLSAAAVVRELRLPPSERTWNGTILGIPYDFRVPTVERARRRWWNPNDPSLLTPKVFGVGWDINFYQLVRLLSPGG